MLKKRRGFTEEFKQNAVKHAQGSSKTIKQIAKELGIGFSTLTRWKTEYTAQPDKQRKPRSREILSDTESENIRLKKDLERLKKENEILKKATAFFARDLL